MTERVYQSPDITELAKALAAAQGEMKHAVKDAENPAFKRDGKGSLYADLPAVLDAGRPCLSKNGLSVVHIPDVDESGRAFLICQLNHSSGQWIRGWYPLNPVKNDPQGLGSSITYGRRFSFCCITGIAAAEEDDDGNAASGQPRSESKPKAKPAETKAPPTLQQRQDKMLAAFAMLQVEVSDVLKLAGKSALMEITPDDLENLSFIHKKIKSGEFTLADALATPAGAT